ncbi:MAG: HAMP domain-containing sensor histidine kinase [Mucilaginibacter sp.]
MQQKKLADIKNDFISNISHELKTPIATTLAAVQGMQYFDVLKDDKKTEQYLSTASNELERLSAMVTKILNISIFESADFTLNPTEFNLKELIESIIASQEIRQEKPISLTLNYLAAETVFADKTHLYNVIINLIDNAIKYSADKVTISIDCMNIPKGIKLSIQDDGPGIAQEYQKNVFDKFFRVPNPNDHSVKGYGLGLNYVKHIIEKHGGTIAIKSDDTGSIFIIKLSQYAPL